MSGIGDITIGDTICAAGCVEPLPVREDLRPHHRDDLLRQRLPLRRQGGQVRHLPPTCGTGSCRETLKDVSLRVSETDSTDAFNVAGRGEMSLSILIETMRREGYEFQVSPPRVLYQEIDGVKCEPMERLVVDVPADAVGAVIEKIGSRKGDLLEMTPVGTRMKLEFLVPARGLFGYRNEFLTDTKGEGIMASVFDSYAPYKGEFEPPQLRLPRRLRDRRVASPTASGQRPGARRAVHRRGRARLCRHGGGRDPQAGGHLG
ncbi:MAG: hypothetical protein ACLT9P_03450 [Evtepia gabavorous]